MIRPGRIARNVIWSTAGEFITRLIGLGIAIYLARVLGAAGFGALGSAFALVACFRVVVNAGLDPYGTREAARNTDQIPRVFARIAGLRLILAFLSLILIAAILFVFPERVSSHPELIIIYAAGLFADAVSTVWALRGLEKMKQIALGMILQHILMALGIFLLVRDPDSDLPTAAMIQVAGLFAMQILFYSILAVRFGPLITSFRIKILLSIGREALPLTMGKVAGIFYFQGGVLLLGLLSSDARAGEFLASHKIIMSIAVIGMILQTNVFPTLSRLTVHSPLAALNFQTDIQRHSLVALIPVVVFGAWYAEPVIHLIYGPEYAGAADILFWVLFSLPLFTINISLKNLLLAFGKTNRYLFTSSLIAGVHVALAIRFIPTMAGVGAAYACLAGEMAGLVCLAIVVRRLVGRYPFQPRLISPLVSGVAMALGFFLANETSMWVQLTVGITLYLSASVLFGSLHLREFLWIWTRLRRLKPS